MPLSSFLPPFTAPPTFLSPARCFFFSYVTCILPFKKQEEAPHGTGNKRQKRPEEGQEEDFEKGGKAALHVLQQTLPAFETALRQREKARRKIALTPRIRTVIQGKAAERTTAGRVFSAVAFSTSREPSFAKADHTKKASRSSKDREAFLCAKSLCTACIANQTARFAREGLPPRSSCSLRDVSFPRGCAGSLP